MALDYTGMGAARFSEPATLGWGEPYLVDGEASYRLKLKVRKVSGADCQIQAGFLCYDAQMAPTGQLWGIVETVSLDTNWSYYQADFLDTGWPAGTERVIQVFQFSTASSEVEVDEFLCEDIKAINEAQKVQAWAIEGFYTKTDADGAIAQKVLELRAQIEDPNGTSIGASLVQDYYTKVDADSAIAAADTSLKAQIEDPSGASVGALLSTSYYTKSDTDGAISAQMTALRSEYLDADSAIYSTLSTSHYTKAATDSAISAQITTLKTQVESPTGTSVGAALEDLKQLKSSAINGTAFGSFRTSVLADVAGLQSSATAQGSAISTLEGNASAGYLIKAQAGQAVASIDLIAADGSGDTKSSIKFDADNLIVNGTIHGDHISVNSLDAISANLGSIKVDTGNIKNLAVDTLKIAGYAVATGKIANQAVTEEANSFVEANKTCLHRTTTRIQNIDFIPRESGRVHVRASFVFDLNSSYYVTLTLNRDSTKLADLVLRVAGAVTIDFVDTGRNPGTSYNYEVEAYVNSNSGSQSGTVSNRFISCMEFKK